MLNLLAFATIISALKTALGEISFKRKYLIFAVLASLFYLSLSVILSLILQNISFRDLLNFLTNEDFILVLALSEIAVDLLLIFLSFRIRDESFISRRAVFLSSMIALPNPLTLCIIGLSISWLQLRFQGLSSFIIGIAYGAFWASLISAWLITAKKFRFSLKTKSNALITIGILFTVSSIFLPIVLTEGGENMQIITKILYLISNAHLIPVVVGLIIYFGWILICLGRHIAQYVERKEERRAIRAAWFSIEDIKFNSPEDLFGIFTKKPLKNYFGKFIFLVKDSLYSPKIMQRAIDSLEMDMARNLESMIIASRMGPIFGLMGTLVPMGPALTNLASGNLQGMANQMIVAFTTTVLGLTIGGLSFVIFTIRRRWFAEDLKDIEYLYELITLPGSAQEEPVRAIDKKGDYLETKEDESFIK